jgi:hypothetical protein
MTIKYSGGEVRSRPLYGSEVWNRDPLPPAPPAPVYSYRLVVKHPEESVPAQAVSTSFEALQNFEREMRQLGYEFLKLERLEHDKD